MSSGEKTEQPTPKKIRDARNKGQVPHSKDVSSTALLLGLFAYLLIGGGWIFENLQEMITFPGDVLGQPFEEAFPAVITLTFYKILIITLPLLGLVMVIGIATNFFLVGPMFVVEPLKPDLKKLDPVGKAKQIFSFKNAIEFVKSSIKVIFLGILLYLVIRGAISSLVEIPYSGIEGVLQLLSELLYQVAKYTIFAYVVIAFADFIFQRWQFTKQLMMTKDEVKQEYKEMEGDPTIKSKRKQLHQEMVMNSTVQKTRKSSVLVTNPTHRAVALYYQEGETKLPLVTAKGEGFLAKRMIEVAQEEGIPIMQNVPLAHELFDNGELGAVHPERVDRADRGSAALGSPASGRRSGIAAAAFSVLRTRASPSCERVHDLTVISRVPARSKALAGPAWEGWEAASVGRIPMASWHRASPSVQDCSSSRAGPGWELVKIPPSLVCPRRELSRRVLQKLARRRSDWRCDSRC